MVCPSAVRNPSLRKWTTDAGEDVGKGSLRYHWWECKLVPTAVEISMEVPQNSESGTPLGLDHNAHGCLLKGLRADQIWRMRIYCNSIYNNQVISLALVSVNRWVDKESVICVSIGYAIYTEHSFIHLQNRLKLWHLQENEHTRGHCITWNKQDLTLTSYKIWSIYKLITNNVYAYNIIKNME